MSAYLREFDETKWMSFFIKDTKLLEKCNETLEKIKNSLKNSLIVNQYTMKNI